MVYWVGFTFTFENGTTLIEFLSQSIASLGLEMTVTPILIFNSDLIQ